MEDRRVTFLEDVEVRDHAGGVEQAFCAGKTYVLMAPSADRWIRRRKAVLVAPESKPRGRPPRAKK